MIYVVLGMGNSGTTLASELLHHSCIRMTDVEQDTYDGGEKYEDPKFRVINMELLSRTDPSCLRPSQAPTSLTSDQRVRMRSLIEGLHEANEDWGFKDPRTVVTYPLWRELLPEHRIVAVWRDPAGNWPRRRWRGLRRRYVNPWRAFCHLRQWCEYNEVILKYGAGRGDDFLLINYESLINGNKEFERLETFIGCKLVDKRQPKLYRARGGGDLLFRLVRAMMGHIGPYRPSDLLRKLKER